MSKRLYFSKIQKLYQKTWHAIKEAIGNEKYKEWSIPKNILVEKKSITETKSIAEKLYKYFTLIGPNLVKDVSTSTKSFIVYINKHGTTTNRKINIYKSI